MDETRKPTSVKPIPALAVALTAIVSHARAAVPRDFVVDLTASVADTSPHITLSWTQRLQSNIASQKIHRRLKGAASWTQLAELGTGQTTYTDTTALPGTEYEYWMERRFNGVSPNVAMGYLSAGVKVPEIHARGILLLVIDDTMASALAPEIALLESDLAADGWTVRTIIAPRTGTVTGTKALIKAAYDEDPANTGSLFLLGRIPVPYSGNIAPDGHGDHVGAWPADGYYGDMDGIWTDTTVNNTNASGTRNDNVPGDGKFDQSSFPSTVELQVGRVDLAGMNRAPSSGVTEVSRLRRYLRQAHEFRHKTGAYAGIPRRSIIRDGFGHFYDQEPFAAQGWATAFSSVGAAIDTPGTGQWFTTTFASGNDYLFGHGCGGGSYDSASGFGNSTDFGTKASRVVFTSLFGSYFGDWAADNNLMRAAICGNAEGTSLGLTCFWSGRPHWFTHQPGMGETWGHAARTSMNAGQLGANGYVPGGSSFRGIHIALMGDPALRMHVVEPPRGLSATSSGGNVSLSWAASSEPGTAGYHVYRAASPKGPFTRLTPAPVSTAGYIDTTPPAAACSYLVKTLKLETVPGGSYYNLSIGSAVTITPSTAPDAGPANPSGLEVSLSRPILLAGFHQFDGTAGTESADTVHPGFSGTVTKSTESRPGGGSDDTFYGNSRVKVPPGADGFLRMTGNFTITVTHSGDTPRLLDALYFDSTSLNAGSLLNVSCSLNGGPSVSLNATPIALPTSTASDTETRPYGDFGLPLPDITMSPGDTIVFTVSLAAGSCRLDNIALTARPPFTGTTLDLTWTDNSGVEAGFRIERRDSPTGPFNSIGTVPADTTSFTDTSVPYQAGAYTYRVVAIGVPDSPPSAEAIYEAVPGIVSFDQALGKYDKVTGTANIPVTRESGSHGTVTVNFATSNSSAGTHYTATTGSVTWQDGESGTKNISIPLINAPSLPRQFKVTLTSPTGGLGLGMRYIHSALIGDSSATLESPWISGSFGTLAQTSPAINGDGAIGDAIAGGTAPSEGGTAESGSFIHQSRTGDGTIVTRIRGVSPTQTAARFGVMIRASLATNSAMAAALASSNTTTGTKFSSRATTGGAAVIPNAAAAPGNVNSLVVPTWVRLTRLGSLFIAEASSDGNSWSILGSQSIPDMPQTALWGIYHCADGIYSTQLGDFHLIACENSTVGAPVLPPAPASFTLASPTTSGATLSWASHLLAASYRIERRGDDGSSETFAASSPTTHTDATALPDTAYEYRVSAVNSGGSTPSPFIRIATPPASGPLRPGFLDFLPGTGTSIALSWFDSSSVETGTGIERRAANGDWAPLHILPANSSGFTDTTVLPGVLYHYRVRHLTSGQPSSWATRFPMPSAPPVAAPGTASGYRLWLLDNGLPMDESGAGHATATPSDGSPPLMIRYALGLPASRPSISHRLYPGTVTQGGLSYASLSFVQSETPPPDITCIVEHSPDLTPGSWRSDGVVLVAATPQSGTLVTTYRLASPVSPGNPSHFLRLRVTRD